MSGPRVVLGGLVMGESVRWHDGQLWFCDWGAGEIIRLEGDRAEVVGRMAGLPFCIDWLPDGRLVVVDGPGGQVLRQGDGPGGQLLRQGDGPGGQVLRQGDGPGGQVLRQGDGPGGQVLRQGDAAGGQVLRQGDESGGRVLGRDDGLVVHADLRAIGGTYPWNDIATDSRGNVFVNNIGYDFPGGEAAPGRIAVVTPGGVARQVAGGLLFPNGMAVTADDSTLIVAESHGERLTAFDIAPDGSLGEPRVWAPLPGAAPDGICIDPSGAVWYADVPNRQCVRVREGGEVLATVPLDRGGFDCALAETPGGPVLYVVTADYTDPAMFANRTGQLVSVPV